MSYDRKPADRLRAVLSKDAGVVERTMFGGLAFLLRDNMCCGVVGEDLVLRVGPDDYAAALQEPHARKMDFTGNA